MEGNADMSKGHWIRGVACAIAAAGLFASAPADAQKKPVDVNIIYGAPSSTSWPLWLAKEGGYFEKYGINATVTFGMHPAGPAAVVSGDALTHNLGLDTSILAAIKGDQLVLVASPLHVGQFVLLGRKEVENAKALEGKRVAVGRIGDPPYFYGMALLETLGVDVSKINWVSAGAPPQRALAIRNNLADAAMITPPDYYKMADEGFKVLGRLQEHRNIPIATSYLFRRKTVTEQPELVENFLKAHLEAVKRFYDDKAFSVGVIKKYAKIEDDAILSRLYDETKAGNIYERVPYVPAQAVKGIVERNKADTPELATYDLKRAIIQTPIDKLVDSGFIEQLFGPSVKEQIAKNREGAFR